MVENQPECLTLNFHAKNGQIEPLDLDVFIREIHFEAIWGLLRSIEATESHLNLLEVIWGHWRLLEATEVY